MPKTRCSCVPCRLQALSPLFIPQRPGLGGSPMCPPWPCRALDLGSAVWAREELGTAQLLQVSSNAQGGRARRQAEWAKAGCRRGKVTSLAPRPGSPLPRLTVLPAEEIAMCLSLPSGDHGHSDQERQRHRLRHLQPTLEIPAQAGACITLHVWKRDAGPGENQ